MNVNKININQQETSYYIASDIYDVSYHNNNTTFASLSALLSLSSETLSTLIPSEVRCGGMTIRFIQSSDNKYVQYRLMSNEFTTDTTQWAIDDESVYIENPEFLSVKVDAEGKLLWWIEKDGSVNWSKGVPTPIQVKLQELEQKIKDNSYDDKPLSDRISDNEAAVVSINDALNNYKVEVTEALNKKVDGEYIENPEFIEVELDVDDKILGGRKTDGTKFENIALEIGGHTLENIEDLEGRSEITTDSEGKIISYRDIDGVKHENVGIETDNANINHLNLTDMGMTEFQQALKNAGFQHSGAGDWSDKESMYIPEPRLAHLNIITNFNLVNLTKTSNVKCAVEFFDGAGNYFKKWIILNGQGRSSLMFIKKGLGADFFNEDPNSETFDEDNVFSIKFGDWVYQDSFHIKSYYTDFPRCTSPVVYKLTDEVVRTRGVMNDRPYKKYYVGEYSDAANANSHSDLDKNMETSARCFPDGFPVIVYQNGEFWGVNAWQLKKHRDNYQ